MAAAIELEKLPDDELQSVYDRAGELLATRKKERQQTVIEEARAALANVGLTLRDLMKAGKRTPRAKSSAAIAQTFTNPADPSQTWTPGRGRPPKWAKKLQAGSSSTV